ncbi:MAG: MFS transporter [Planctomycetota bacterium]|jgi:MFS family permease
MSEQRLDATRIKSGIAAWLGWMFDGLDMHLYTLVAVPFVALLLGGVEQDSLEVKEKAGFIQASFLVGWAMGGAFFGVVGDRLGRSRALMLTILTYALFTGLSFFAQTWWQLMICRFLAALGIGGEWAVGASLLSETWPARWRPWMAAILQSAVNIGVILATVAGWLMAGLPHRFIFLVGVLPAFLVLWIRKAVPEPEEWAHASRKEPSRIADLFGPSLRRTTLVTLLVCGLSLSGHWAFTFWSLQQIGTLAKNELKQQGKDDPETVNAEVQRLKSASFAVLMGSSVAGNFMAGGLARVFGYRKAILGIGVFYALSLFVAYGAPRGSTEMTWWLIPMGLGQGMFGLFTMYLPPLFPTLLRTTGAGFCYNFGRLAAAAGTVLLIYLPVHDMREALFWAGVPFLVSVAVGWLLPELNLDGSNDA